MEIWKPVPGYEGKYEVSNCGRIKALERYVSNNGGMQFRSEKILKARQGSNGYQMVILCSEGKRKGLLVHRIVAEAFVSNPYGKTVVDHIDTNTNNNHADNLQWVTHHENAMNPLSRKHKSDAKKGHTCVYKGKTWKNIDGKRVWLEKGELYD